MRLDQVGKRYGIRLPWVVRDVSLDVLPGKLVRLEGRNGTGKSTLLRIMAGVSVPSRGKVTGRPVTGFVPERFPPALPFSARDYLGHVGRMHGVNGDSLAKRIEACLGRMGGMEFADVPLRNMSKGMCQKVAVAQALLPRFGLLVLDEAWTGLDVEAKAALDEAVAERLDRGGSVVFVDHDPARLSHLEAERWRVEAGAVTRVEAGAARAGGTPGSARAGGTAGSARAGGSGDSAQAGEYRGSHRAAKGARRRASRAAASGVLIEIAGWPGGVRFDRVRGVSAVDQDDDRLTVLVEPEASDHVLRGLLAAGPDVHVLGVQVQDGGER
ncbi:MAG TPA: ATP-binding cassette domain-containing protein [Streptosporangiaceae bacterium]|nr:ATP-binding cassette domain-containing protein [Streptosporangiaceae bacterium]